jgi:amino acid transporter
MCQLAKMLQCGDGSSYTYLLNTVNRSWWALLAASFILLDAVATGSVSAATAASYISNQVHSASPSATTFINGAGLVIVLLTGMTLITLLGLRDSANIALVMLTIHLVSMTALIIAGIVQWAKSGSTTFVSNWHEATAMLSNGKGIARSLFDGTSIAFVGLTGFEMTPTYRQSVKQGHFDIALRSLHLATLLIEVPLALLVVVLIPLQTGLGASNVLAVLAQVCSSSDLDGASSWLKLIVVVDAVLVLMGGILTGIQACIGLCQCLAHDGILASVFLSRMIKTQAHHASIALFPALCLVFCAVFHFDMATMSSVFSMTFLFVMLSFHISLALIKWNRPSLLQDPASSQCEMACITLAITIAVIAISGNVALQPIYLLQTALLALAIFVALWILKGRVNIARFFLWLVNEKWVGGEVKRGSFHLRGFSKIQSALIKWMKRKRSKPIVFLSETDEISHLVQVLRYIGEVSLDRSDKGELDADTASLQNETTSRVIVVHCFQSLNDLPSELESNIQLVDEAFPKITVDLIFVQAELSPVVVETMSRQLRIPKHRFFLTCPSAKSKSTLHDFGNLRIIIDDM